MAMTDAPDSVWPPYMPPKEDWAAPFWNGLSDGNLVLQQCEQCRVTTYPPIEEHCTACGSELTWITASGAAELWSWVTFHRVYYSGYPLDPPYTVLMAELPEGPRILATLAADVEPGSLQCGMKLLFSPLELALGTFIPGFRPLE